MLLVNCRLYRRERIRHDLHVLHKGDTSVNANPAAGASRGEAARAMASKTP